MKIAVLICSLVFDAQKAFMKGIERRVRDLGDICSVFCCHVNITGNDTYTKGEYSIFDLPDFTSYDGIVFVRNTFQDAESNNALAKRIAESGVPCVCVDSYSPEFVNILSDEAGLTEEVTRHLITVHGCKKFYFLGGMKESKDTIMRFKGFSKALAEYGLSSENTWEYYGNYEYPSGVAAAEYFLNLPDGLPDAVVCCNDEMAIGLITEFKRRGIKIPKEVKVTGIDYDSVSRIYTPRLTTCKRQQYQKAVNSINVLHEYSEHTKGEKISLPIVMFRGESCGCKPDEDTKIDITTTNALAVDRYSQSELTQTVKRMTADLMSKREYYDLLDSLKEYGCKLHAEELYLCMNVRPEYLIDYSDYTKALSYIDRDNQEDYSEEIISVVSVKNGQVPEGGDEREYFERKDLLPPIAKGGKSGGTYYFFPIHYMNRNFGYAVLGTSGELVRNDFFPNWCTLASNALENSRKRTVMEQMIAALDRMWIYDTLTGIYNRAGFFKLSESIISDAVEHQVPVCVVFMDVDGLKEVNDEFGHDEGDKLIKSVANILKDSKRHGEIIMRYGGDEFVLLAAGYTDADAEACVSKLEASMNAYNEASGKGYAVEASIGYCITTLKSPDELNNLIEDADHAMYKKKYVKKALRNKTAR